MDEFKFDKRVIRRNIENNKLSKEEYNKYLANLDDLTDSCTDITDKILGLEVEEEIDETDA